jgi:hypothetical protein
MGSFGTMPSNLMPQGGLSTGRSTAIVSWWPRQHPSCSGSQDRAPSTACHDNHEGFGVKAEGSDLGLDLDQRPARCDLEGGQRVGGRDPLVGPVDSSVGEQLERGAGLELVDPLAFCHGVSVAPASAAVLERRSRRSGVPSIISISGHAVVTDFLGPSRIDDHPNPDPTAS